MAGGDAEIWVCAKCRSVNKLRAKQCYNCRTPKDRAAVDPLAVDLTSHGQVREITLPDFQPSRPFAVVASVLILAIGGMQALTSLVDASFALRLLEGEDPSAGEIVNVVTIGFATIGLGLIALIAWATWLSKAVRVMPALGLGYPSANGLMAFLENFIPVLNLWRVPAIVRDVVSRLEPTESKGGALISAAWIGLIAGYLLPRFGRIMNSLGSDTVEGYVRNQVVVQAVAAGLVLTGSVFLVALIWWIEVRISRRRTSQLAESAGAPVAPAAAAETHATTATSTETVGMAAVPGVAGVVPYSTPSRTPVPATVPGPLGAMPAAVPGPLGAPVPATVPGPLTTPVQATVPGPLGAMPAPHPSDDVLNRSITAAGGSTPAMTVPEAPPPPTPTGPRLRLAVETDGSMIATLDDESEPITLPELRAAAAVLSNADGSAAITTRSASVEARAIAGQALQILSDAGVPATVED